MCAAIDGFRGRYGRWPTRICVPTVVVDDLKWLFTARGLLTLSSKIQLVIADDPLVAEDDDGGRYAYAATFPGEPPKPSAREWLGVEPQTHLEDTF